MTPRRKRLITVLLILAGVGTSVAFALQAFQKNLLYFYSPSQVSAGEAPIAREIRVGGMVEKGSVVREPGSLEVRFTLTDFANRLTVSYSGVLPDSINTYTREFTGQIVDQINGVPILRLKDVEEALKKETEGGFITVKLLGEGRPLVLDRSEAHAAQKRIMEKYGVEESSYIE